MAEVQGSSKGKNKALRTQVRKKRFEGYRSSGKKERNKLKKLEKHLKKHPNDVQSKERRAATYPKKKPLEDKDISFTKLWKMWVIHD